MPRESTQAPGPSRSRAAVFGRQSLWSTEGDTRAHLQQRALSYVRLVLGSMTIYALTVAVVRLGFKALVSPNEVPAIALGLSGMLVVALVLRYLRRGPRSLRQLQWADAIVTIYVATIMAGAGYLVRSLSIARLGMFIGMMFLVMTRALVVPSRWRRTAAITAIVMFAGFVASLMTALLHANVFFIEPTTEVTLLGVWSAIAIMIASYGSSVIYGLRQKVKAARQLGQYTLLDKIGEGGMGVVYRAKHALLRRPTAVKLLPASRAGAAQLRRFEREVQLTAELTHPNTIAIYDYGHSSDGTFYYAMELLSGFDLSTLIKTFGAQPLGRVLHILQQACGALAEAHERGLVHRDVKPANIVLCQRGGVPDMVKVLDFGLVKQLTSDADQHTQTHAVAGTPTFMSPETMTAPETVGPASDIYALGALGFYLITGQHLFNGATAMEVCSHHLHSKPQAASQRLGEPLPAAFDALLLRCVAKRAEQRVQSARELRRQLLVLQQEHPWSEADAQAWWDNQEGDPQAHLGAYDATLVDPTDHTEHTTGTDSNGRSDAHSPAG